MDGNKSFPFLQHVKDISNEDWFKEELQQVIDYLAQLEEVKRKTFSYELEDGWEESVNIHNPMFAELQGYCISILQVKLSCSWKMYILSAHLKTFLKRVNMNLYH